MTEQNGNDLAALLAEVIRSNNSPAMQRAREAIAYRVALSGDVSPARIPAPKNITEIGGYINLLQRQGEKDLLAQSLATALGVAGPVSGLFDPGVEPELVPSERPNQRPEGPQRNSWLLSVSLRPDFAQPLFNVLDELHDFGCALPLHAPRPTLPVDASWDPAEADLLWLVGRGLRIAPTAALNDPTTDPVLLARAEGAAEVQLLCRQIDPDAPRAGELQPADWTLWACDEDACEAIDIPDIRTLAIAPLLDGAGWIPARELVAPAERADIKGWEMFYNLTGLVPGETTLRDELSLLHSRTAIAASNIRTHLSRVWNGEGFA